VHFLLASRAVCSCTLANIRIVEYEPAEYFSKRERATGEGPREDQIPAAAALVGDRRGREKADWIRGVGQEQKVLSVVDDPGGCVVNFRP
jgi:hypothetical protein